MKNKKELYAKTWREDNAEFFKKRKLGKEGESSLGVVISDLFDGVKTKRNSEWILFRGRAKYMHIADMRMEGMNNTEISKKVKFSRERVRQIIKNFFSHLEFPEKIKKVRFVICATCSNKKEIPSFAKDRKYCSMDCYYKTKSKIKSMSPEEWRIYNNKRCKEYYQKKLKGTVAFKLKTRERNKRYALKRKEKNET